MGHLGTWPAGAVLQSDRGGPKTVGTRDGSLGTALRRDRARSAGGLTCSEVTSPRESSNGSGCARNRLRLKKSASISKWRRARIALPDSIREMLDARLPSPSAAQRDFAKRFVMRAADAGSRILPKMFASACGRRAEICHLRLFAPQCWPLVPGPLLRYSQFCMTQF